MKKRNFFFGIIALLMLPVAGFAQWQADMTNSMQGHVQKYVVHSDGSLYRYDFTSGEMNGVVIVNPKENLTAILLVDEKKVHYAPADGGMSQMNDPVQAYPAYLVYGEEKKEGNESVNGYSCIKTVVIYDEKPLVTQWFSEELNFPVKIENHSAEDTYMLLENIEAWKVDPSIFIVPEEYLEVDEEMRPVIPEPAPPAEWVETKVTVPVDMAVSRGMLIIVPIEETEYHKFIVENTGDTPAKFIYHMYKDGVELPDNVQGTEERRTDRLYMEENYRMTHNWKAGQVIKIKVYEGSAKLIIYKE